MQLILFSAMYLENKTSLFCALIHNVYGFYFLLGRISFHQFQQLAVVCPVQCQLRNRVRLYRRSQLEAPVCFRFVLVDLRCSKVNCSSWLDSWRD
jgi:hypothetical protein